MKPGVVVEIGGTLYGASRKVGSVSLLVSGREVDSVPDVLFVREPLDRLASAWAFFRNNFTGSDVRAFVDRVLSGWRDPHWIPQSEVWSSWGELRRFERLPEVVSRHENASRDRPIIEYRRAELAALYAADVELYARAA